MHKNSKKVWQYRCALFLIYILRFPAYFMHTLMYTQKSGENVPASVCTL